MTTKTDHFFSAVAGVAAAGVVAAGTGDGALAAAAVAAAAVAFADKIDFKTSTIGSLGTLAVVFGIEAHHLKEDNILVPKNDNVYKAIALNPDYENQLVELGEGTIYNFAKKVIEIDKTKKVKKAFCAAQEELGLEDNSDICPEGSTVTKQDMQPILN